VGDWEAGENLIWAVGGLGVWRNVDVGFGHGLGGFYGGNIRSLEEGRNGGGVVDEGI